VSADRASHRELLGGGLSDHRGPSRTKRDLSRLKIGRRAARRRPFSIALQSESAGPKPAPRCLVLQPCGFAMVAGKLRGAPPIEIGPTGVGCRAILLRTTRDSRLRARPVGMEEVT